ncbi:MAG: PQQ-dependent sugar dehydrogenase [Deltaproteobacteria bacterium]|jgi:aldose sugar dehydrogenase|nr:PQQ-dependent sugar dehydrogenase [Deltaproteobacteria bacterium]
MIKMILIIAVFITFNVLDILGSEPFEVEIITKNLHYPWGIVFIDDRTALVTEKTGKIKKITLNNGKKTTISGGPKVIVVGQGGLLDIVKHPLFNQNQLLYFSYSKQIARQNTTAVARGRLIGNKIKDIQDILITNAISQGGHHFGSRLAFDKNGLLYVTVGERGDRKRAQLLNSHAGKVLRVKDDGTIPEDNPYVKKMNVKPEIYTWGHRNPQGLVYDAVSDRMWLHEHGPKGGDEVNLLKAGLNYGWPVITYGREYSGFKVTDQTHHPDMSQPTWQWTPSIAPSGLLVVTGHQFPQWKGDLLVGALKFRLISHLSLNQAKVVSEKRYLKGLNERIRALKMGPKGNIYLLTDSSQGQLIKLSTSSK